MSGSEEGATVPASPHGLTWELCPEEPAKDPLLRPWPGWGVEVHSLGETSVNVVGGGE